MFSVLFSTKVNDKGLKPEMLIWYISLFQSYLKWGIHLDKRLFLILFIPTDSKMVYQYC